MLGAIISGAASVLGGILGGEEKSNTKMKQRTHSNSSGTTASKTRANLTAMVEAAEKNGFNPLTVLQAGGLAAYSKTISTSSSESWSNSKGKNSSSSSSMAPLGAGIAAAGAAIGGAIQNVPSKQAENAQAAWQAGGSPAASASEYDSLQAQLKQVQPGDLGTQPRLPVAQVTKQPTPALASGVAGSTEAGERTATNPFRAGSGWLIDGAVPDPGTRYQSEIGEMVNDAYVAYHDIKKNVVESDWLKEAKRDLLILQNKYLPVYKSEASKPANLWDPVAITLGIDPVVETKKVPDLYTDPFPAWKW